MGNEQSISSNIENDNIKQSNNINNQIHIPHSKQKNQKKNLNNNVKYIESTSSDIPIENKSEMSNSDITMKETNESIYDVNINMKNSLFNNQNREIITSATSNAFQFNNSNLINRKKNIFYKIVWNEGGDDVLISGNFVNWNQWLLMNKKDQHYEIIFVIV